jgi:hypothetical protein
MGHIGYGPAAEAIRAERGLPYATGADEPPDWHNHPGMTGPDDPAPGQPGAQPEGRTGHAA